MYASLFLFVSDNDVSDIYEGADMAWLLKAGAFAAAAGIAMVNIDWFRKVIFGCGLVEKERCCDSGC